MRPRPSRRMRPRVDAARRDDDADERLALEMYFDFWALCSQYEIDAGRAVRELERWVRAAR